MTKIKKQLNLLKLASNFIAEADIGDIKAYGSGHINDTYYIKNKHDNGTDYLLQRINHTVFRDVPALMENISLVTDHLRTKLSAIPGADPDKEVLSLIRTHSYLYYYLD